MIRVGQTWLVHYRYNGTLGATVAPALHVNGVASGATVTLTTSTAGIIVASVSLAGLAVEDRIQFVGGSAVIDNVTQSLTSAEARITSPELTAAGVRTELSTELGRIDATVSSRSTYAGADTSGTTTLLSRLTSIRAGNLDNLDATISSRSTFASGGSVVASNFVAAPSVSAIKAELFSTASLSNKINVTASGHVESDVTAWGGDIDPPQAPTASEVWSNPTRTLTGEIEVDEQAIADAVASALAGVNVTVQSPVASDGTISIVQGDAYAGTITLTASGLGVAQAGQTHTLRLLRRAVYERSGTSGEADTEVTTTATNVSGNAVASFTLSSTDTASLDSVYPVDRNPQYVYQWLNATTGKTFAIGNVEVKRAILPEA